MSAYEVWTYAEGSPDWEWDSSHGARVSALWRCLTMRRAGVLTAIRTVTS